ncbi:MAG: insulinase family protein, partial [bacterium]|nr:insulinase family protein [bacterium]
DPPGKVGAAAMTADVWRNGGSASLSGDELDRQLEDRGALLTTETTREETWLRLSVLKEDLSWGMNLMAGLLANPLLPADKLEEVRGQRRVDLQQRLDVPMSVAQALFPQLVFGKGNPWGWTQTVRTLDALTTADLHAFYESFYHCPNLKLGLAGDVDWTEAQRLARETFGRLPRGSAPPAVEAGVEPVEKTKVYIVPRDVTQNVLYVGHEGIGRFTPEKFAVKVFNNVLSGGFTSRMFKEIRSDRGLAYAVFGMLTEGTVRGLFYNVAMTKVPSSAEALRLMLRIDEDLRQKPPTPDEVALARQAEINSFVFFFDTPEKIIRQKMTLDAFGYPPDYLQTYVAKLKAVTPDEVRAAADKDVHPDRVIVLVVGKIDAALRQRLDEMGQPIEITDEILRKEWL